MTADHIRQPHTLDELHAKIASNEYSAELLLQHAMLLLDRLAPAEWDALPTTEAGWLHHCNQRFAEGYEKGLAAQRQPSLPIERDEQMGRDYIPLPGGWEVQTKGNGSTFRICDTKDGERMPIPLPDRILAFLERMAREVNAASQPQPKGTEPVAFVAQAALDWLAIPGRDANAQVHTPLTKTANGSQATPIYTQAPAPAHAESLAQALASAMHALVLRGDNGTSPVYEHCAKALEGYRSQAPAVAPVQPKAAQAFLCRAWGESDFPAAELVPDWDGVRDFMVREWLGDADSTDYDGTVTLDRLKTDFDEHEEDQRGGPYEIEFEIGGVSIERVVGFAFAPASQPPVQPMGDSNG